MIRVGLIGFGLAGRYFHAPLIRAAGMQLHAIVTSRDDAVRESVPEAMVLDSAGALFARADIDLVVIATPNQLHAEQATDALRAGKHVVVDKPLSITSAQARAASELASANRLRLAVFQNRRWDSDFLTVRKLIHEDRLGAINAFHARWDRFRPVVADRWRERAEPGAGALYDLGSHLIDQALCLFGRPDWIQADVFTQRAGGAVDDAFEILMGKGTLRITLGVSSLIADGGWRYRIHGARGSFLKAGLDLQEPQLRAGMQPDSPDFGFEPADQWGKLVLGADGSRHTIASERGRWTAFYEGMRNSIERNEPVPVPADAARATLEIIEAALRSSAERRRIDLQ
jgi:scyllo-inositol 2-dehydrogenase (NADP+)